MGVILCLDTKDHNRKVHIFLRQQARTQNKEILSKSKKTKAGKRITPDGNFHRGLMLFLYQMGRCLLNSNLLTVLDEDTLLSLAYALASYVVDRSVNVVSIDAVDASITNCQSSNNFLCVSYRYTTSSRD